MKHLVQPTSEVSFNNAGQQISNVVNSAGQKIGNFGKQIGFVGKQIGNGFKKMFSIFSP
ncbi:hypothetical protein Scep_007836 [Stephania cephalantha]|uniref:Uncharacterized protein n=1 Tax=Stephania cephalantha TaxID=152367 RepID=A0AAP0PNL8_9MAGN